MEEKKENILYKFIKKTNFITFFTVHIIISAVLFTVLGRVDNLGDYSELFNRFVIGLPLIFQLILTFIVYRQNKDNKFIKVLFIAVFIYTLIWAALGLYERYMKDLFLGETLIKVGLAIEAFGFVMFIVQKLLKKSNKST